MAGESYISSHNWWNWRAKTDSLVTSHDRELENVRRREERQDRTREEQFRELNERIGELSELNHEIRESIIALEGQIKDLARRSSRIEQALSQSLPSEWQPKFRPVVIGGGVVGGGSALGWLIYLLFQFGKAAGWW